METIEPGGTCNRQVQRVTIPSLYKGANIPVAREAASLASLPLTLGLLDDLLMKCPTCGQHTTGQPRFLRPLGPTGEQRPSRQFVDDLVIEGPAENISVTWMECANAECGEIVIWIHEMRREFLGSVPLFQHRTDWVARPRAAGLPPVDPAVPETLAQDFREAHLILDTSPRMAAVMVRSIVEELLTREGVEGSRLTKQIGNLLADSGQPEWLKEMIDPLRSLGDWGAHPFKDTEGNRLAADPEVVRWAVTEAVPQLFDHFIVNPARHQAAIEHVKKLTAEGNRQDLRGPMSQDTQEGGTQ